MKLAEIYGPIVGFFVGPKQPFISICGYEAVREALLNQDLNGRPEGIAFLEKSLGKNLGNDSPKVYSCLNLNNKWFHDLQ